MENPTSKLWKLEVLTLAYVRADTEKEARRKYNEQPCADSADFIQSIKEVPEDEEPMFILEE